MSTGDAKIDTFISAVLTLLAIGMAFRFYLGFVNRKRTTIQRPDWLKPRGERGKED